MHNTAVLSGFCTQLQFVYFVRCIEIFDKSLLHIYLITLELPSASDMSDNRESESVADPMVAESSGSSRGLPGPRARGRARPSPGRMRPHSHRLIPADSVTPGKSLVSVCRVWDRHGRGHKPLCPLSAASPAVLPCLRWGAAAHMLPAQGVLGPCQCWLTHHTGVPVPTPPPVPPQCLGPWRVSA